MRMPTITFNSYLCDYFQVSDKKDFYLAAFSVITVIQEP